VSSPEILVEFYGLARLRAGTATLRIPAADAACLQTLWTQLLEVLPELRGAGEPRSVTTPIYRFNLDGQQFVTDPQTPIRQGQSVLIMSADAGG
jgi:molybdopterin converting factor small subunit